MIKTEVFEIDRRHLLKLTGTMGIGATFVSPTELFAEGACEKVETTPPDVKPEQAGATLQFWIDGLHFGPRSTLKSRANITLFMNLKQSAASFVESVVLLDPKNFVVGARYFDSSMKMLDRNFVPYVRFENVELDHTATYTCIYSVRTGSNLKLYTATIEKPQISTLNTTFLPDTMRTDFQTFLVGNLTNKTPGLITTPFQFYTANGLSAHCARGRITDMASDGSSFNVNIDFMHGDAGPTHYMRYFIVMDPVGRLLGFVKRKIKVDGTYDNTFVVGPKGAESCNVGRITDGQRVDFNVPELQIGNIADCPYVQFYTEDSYDAIARNMIRLR
jgi:hypothetical protein